MIMTTVYCGNQGQSTFPSRLIGILAIFMLLAFSAKSQKLEFCTGITDNANAIEPGHTFKIYDDTLFLYMLVTLPEPFTFPYFAEYEIYEIGSDGQKSHVLTVDQTVESNWKYFWKQMYFTKGGYYKVYLYFVDYDEYEAYITESEVYIYK
jgi:hypothetical protein